MNDRDLIVYSLQCIDQTPARTLQDIRVKAQALFQLSEKLEQMEKTEDSHERN